VKVAREHRFTFGLWTVGNPGRDLGAFQLALEETGIAGYHGPLQAGRLDALAERGYANQRRAQLAVDVLLGLR
jgi:hypothetical protein